MLGKLSGGGEDIRVIFGGERLLEKTENAAAEARGVGEVERESSAGAPVGELGSESAIGGFGAGAILQQRFDFFCGNRSEMKLQAAGADGGEHGIRRYGEENERGGFWRLFEDFQEEIGVGPAHRIGAIENEDAAAALWLEVSGALDGAQLADANHGPRDRREAANGIGNEQPNVWVSFEDERHALDGGGVRAFTTFGEAGFDHRKRISEARDLQARGAFAAEVVLQALAIGGLGEHACKREFADAARAGEEQRTGNAAAAQHPAQRGDDAFIAEKSVEAHELGFCRLSGGKGCVHGSQNLPVNFIGRAQREMRWPGSAARAGAFFR